MRSVNKSVIQVNRQKDRGIVGKTEESSERQNISEHTMKSIGKDYLSFNLFFLQLNDLS